MVSEKKIKLVQKLVKDVIDYPIVGVVNLENLPAQQLQKMKAMLRKQGVKITMMRKLLIKRALEESKKPEIAKLTEKVRGMPALIFSKDNPFVLASTIAKNKSEAPAKAGQTLPKEVIVKAGATNFAPGPIISELASVGIKTKVENGKLAIISDTVVGKEGDIVSPKLAETLKRLDIKPMEIGLDLVAVWEDGLVFDAKQLHIDETEYVQNISQAVQWAFNLAVETCYLTSETTEMILGKASREAKALSIESSFLTTDTTDEILAKSENEAQGVKKEANL
jgi:large subunit ribosomal protein L10